LCDPDALLKLAGGTPTTSYSTFCNNLKMHLASHPVRLAAELTSLPPISDEALSVLSIGTEIPTLADLGYSDEPTSPYRGGETAALVQMSKFLSRKKWVVEFEKPNTSPAVFDPNERSTTILSPYLKV
jgi:cryptochrome